MSELESNENAPLLLSPDESRNTTPAPIYTLPVPQNDFISNSTVIIGSPVNDGNQEFRSYSGENSTTTIISNESDATGSHHRLFICLRRFAGIILALFAGLFGGAQTISVKILTNHGFHPFMLTLIKYQVSTMFGPPILLCIYCRSNRSNIFQSVWPLTNRESIKTVLLVLLRTTLGVMQTILQYYSLQYMNVSDSCVIIMSNSITTVFLSKLFLNEPLGLIPIIVGAITCCGVIVITKPPFLTGKDTFDDNMLTGAALAFTSMIMASLIIVLIRYMRKLHFCVFVTMYGYMATAEVLILITIQYGLGIVMKMPYDPKYWITMFGCAIFAFCGQSLNVLSLQFERASHISLVRTCDIIFTFVLQYIFLGVDPEFNSALGAFILIFGTIIIGLRRWILGLPSEHPYRSRYSCLLK